MILKSQYSSYSLERICGLFDISRQGYNKHINNFKQELLESSFILEKVREIRKDHSRLGGRKLYHMIKPEIKKADIKLGRDKFYNILSDNNLLIKTSRKRVRTTYSLSWLKKHNNLIKEQKAKRINEIWVSDITYWNIGKSFLYIHFITDAFSKRIMGYSVSERMQVKDILPSLEMALDKVGTIKDSLIHHSDRGSQYCSSVYTGILKRSNIKISMTESGDPLENPLAERINGIIKQEYLQYVKIQNIKKARKELSKAVELYNNIRPHMSCNYHTPNEIYEGKNLPKILWKNYYNNTSVNFCQDDEKVVNLC